MRSYFEHIVLTEVRRQNGRGTPDSPEEAVEEIRKVSETIALILIPIALAAGLALAGSEVTVQKKNHPQPETTKPASNAPLK